MTASWSLSEHLAKPLEVSHEHETRSFAVYPRVCVQTEIVFAGENRCFLLERAWCPCYSSRACLADFASFGIARSELLTELSEGRRRREGLFSAGFIPALCLRGTLHSEPLLAGKELAGNDPAPLLLRGHTALSAVAPPQLVATLRDGSVWQPDAGRADEQDQRQVY